MLRTTTTSSEKIYVCTKDLTYTYIFWYEKKYATRRREGSNISKMGDVINGWSLMLDLSDDSNSFFFRFRFLLQNFNFYQLLKLFYFMLDMNQN